MKVNKWLAALLGLLISFTITALVIRYYQSLCKKGIVPARKVTKSQGEDYEEHIVVEDTVPSESDDLTRIKGIGPKIAGALQGAGITTYAQLAAMDPDSIKDILHQAGVPVVASETWAEQAREAVSGI